MIDEQLRARRTHEVALPAVDQATIVPVVWDLTGATASTCRVTARARVSALPSDVAGELDVAQPVGRGAEAER
jgi:hypothetical protein